MKFFLLFMSPPPRFLNNPLHALDSLKLNEVVQRIRIFFIEFIRAAQIS